MLGEVELAAYREARREGMPPATALYAVRPPVVDLDWLSHYQSSSDWAYFVHDGRRFRVDCEDPANFDGSCLSCAELVKAWREKDDGIAWMSPEEYEETTHRVLKVEEVDAEGESVRGGFEASLWGVCGRTTTPTLRRLDERYVAETVLDLAGEVIAQEAAAEERAVVAQRLALFGV